MKLMTCIFGLLCLMEAVKTNEDRLVDPASRVLQNFKDRHQSPDGILTTSAGSPVDIRNTDSDTNSDILTNAYFIETLKQLTSEKIPERIVNPKGAGAHGYFEVINDVNKYTKAKLFEKLGKRTPVFARFGAGASNKGGIDTSLLTERVVSFKFYTEEGNLDFLNIQIPVFNMKSPILFPPLVHTFVQNNPKTDLLDRTALFDLVILRPEGIHSLLWAASEFGLPKGFRRMNGFPIHTYEIYNDHGESFFVRFKFLSELGFDSLSIQEAQNISSIDPDFFTRDLYNSIELKDFPSWRMDMDVLTEKQMRDAYFNPFDLTSLWPSRTYQTISIGRIVLNRNVVNHFAEVEQSTFFPGNLVPGIKAPPDTVFKGRMIAYKDAHVHRVGINHNKIEINCPMYAKTYNRNGQPPTLDNMKDAPHYFPNSFNGPEPCIDKDMPTRRIIAIEDTHVDFQQANRFYNYVLQKDSQKQRLVDALVEEIIRVLHPVQQKFTELLSKVDMELASRFSKSLAAAKKTKYLPAVMSDLKTERNEL